MKDSAKSANHQADAFGERQHHGCDQERATSRALPRISANFLLASSRCRTTPRKCRNKTQVVIAVGLVAVAAAVAMLRKIKIGYHIWFVIIVITILASLWDVCGNFLIARDGGPRFDFSDAEHMFTVFWVLTYAAAYWLACAKTKPQTK